MGRRIPFLRTGLGGLFPHQEYERFLRAVKAKRVYQYRYVGCKRKVEVLVKGERCNYEVWAPHYYFWSISIHDNRKGHSGSSTPYAGGRTMTRDEILDQIYDFLKIERTERQLDLFAGTGGLKEVAHVSI